MYVYLRLLFAPVQSIATIVVFIFTVFFTLGVCVSLFLAVCGRITVCLLAGKYLQR